MPKVGIVVPVFNQCEYTDIFLHTLKESGTPRDLYRLYFINNGSTDLTEEILKNHLDFKGARDKVVQNNENLGVARAWNQGMRLAIQDGCEYVCVCNNDLFLYPEWLERLVNVLENIPEAMAVVPRSTSGDDDHETVFSAEIYPERQKANFSLAKEHLLQGWCFLLSVTWLKKMREAEKTAGEGDLYPWNTHDFALFDEVNFQFAHFEDTDMDNRIRALTVPPLLCPSSFIHHYGSRTLVPNLGTLMPHIEANAKRYEQKYNTTIK